MRRSLDRLYAVALWLSASCLCTIAGLVGLQLAGRIVDGLTRLFGFVPYGFVILSLAEISGYLLAAASFLALAATLKSGVHIRVTMGLGAFSDRVRRYAELWVFGSAALFCTYMVWQFGKFAWLSYRFNEVSTGVIRVPLALPQAVMALGMLILTIALIDELVIVWRRGRPTFRSAEDAITLGKEA